MYFILHSPSEKNTDNTHYNHTERNTCLIHTTYDCHIIKSHREKHMCVSYPTVHVRKQSALLIVAKYNLTERNTCVIHTTHDCRIIKSHRAKHMPVSYSTVHPRQNLPAWHIVKSHRQKYMCDPYYTWLSHIRIQQSETHVCLILYRVREKKTHSCHIFKFHREKQMCVPSLREK